MRRVLIGVLVMSVMLFSSCYSLDIDKETLNDNQEDILYLFQSLMNRHKDYMNSEDIIRAESIVREELDNNRAINNANFFFSLERIAALSHDSHTQVGISEAIREDLLYMPIAIERYGNDIVIVGSCDRYRFLLGKRIVSWGGCTTEELLDRLDEYLSYDNPINRLSAFMRVVFIYDVFEIAGVIDYDGLLSIGTVDSDGNMESYEIEPLDYSEYKAMMEDGVFLDLLSSFPYTYDDGHNFRIIHLSDDAIMFQYNSALKEKGRSLRNEAHRFIEDIREGDYSKVVIDLRYNEGGIIQRLISLIDDLEELKEEKDFELYTLIGPKTFSAAVVNANRIENHMGDNTFVGMPTGSSTSHYGVVSTFKLPKSRIEVSYSIAYLNNHDLEGPIEPDIYIEERFDDLFRGIDSAVLYILDN